MSFVGPWSVAPGHADGAFEDSCTLTPLVDANGSDLIQGSWFDHTPVDTLGPERLLAFLLPPHRIGGGTYECANYLISLTLDRGVRGKI